MSTTSKQAPLFHVGEWVAFDFGPRKVAAKIVEDRGRIGVHGRRIYRVQLDDDRDLARVASENQGAGTIASSRHSRHQHLEELEEPSTFEVPENELEPTPTPVRQSFHVTYDRQGKTNVWRATTERGRIFRGLKAQGAISFSTAGWEGENNEGFATVAVLIEVDPRFADPVFGDPVEAMPDMVRSVRNLADEMFLARYPRAQVKHVEA